MQIKDLLQTGGTTLEKEVLLANLLGKNREFLVANPEYEVTNEQSERFYTMIRSHERGIPVAYLIKHKEFYGLPFFVDSRVLIPRPETEFLVDKILELVKNDPNLKKIVDIGTGSGNIACSLAKNLKDAEIFATDVSDKALEVAKINAKKLDVTISFIKSDLLDELKEMEFDIIVANLPYIGTESNSFVSKETQEHEPHVALFGGVNGLELYEKLFSQVKDFKYLMGEIGFMHREFLEKLFKKYFPDSKCEILKDLAGLDRYFIIKKYD
jgi:release factor glutamine methyltransferase